MPQSVRVLLVDAPALMRSCLASVLRRRRRVEIVGEAGTGSSALSEARILRPDVVVVDPDVPEGGTRLVAELAQLSDGAVVVLATPGAVPAQRMLQAGARGYLEKDCAPDAVVSAIERVNGGELVVSPAPADSMFTVPGSRPSGNDPGGLTDRELEVLRQVASGQTNRQVATELVITEHTVKAHLAKIQSKLGLANRVQLTTYAIQHGHLAAAAS